MKAINARFDGLEGKIDGEFKAVRSEITRLDQEIDSVDKRMDAARRLVVVEGVIGVRIGDGEFMARPGSWVFKPWGVTHTFWNAGPRQARLIEIVTQGAFVHYFEELAAILGAGGPPDQVKLALASHEVS